MAKLVNMLARRRGLHGRAREQADDGGAANITLGGERGRPWGGDWGVLGFQWGERGEP